MLRKTLLFLTLQTFLLELGELESGLFCGFFLDLRYKLRHLDLLFSGTCLGFGFLCGKELLLLPQLFLASDFELSLASSLCGSLLDPLLLQGLLSDDLFLASLLLSDFAFVSQPGSFSLSGNPRHFGLLCEPLLQSFSSALPSSSFFSKSLFFSQPCLFNGAKPGLFLLSLNSSLLSGNSGRFLLSCDASLFGSNAGSFLLCSDPGKLSRDASGFLFLGDSGLLGSDPSSLSLSGQSFRFSLLGQSSLFGQSPGLCLRSSSLGFSPQSGFFDSAKACLFLLIGDSGLLSSDSGGLLGGGLLGSDAGSLLLGSDPGLFCRDAGSFLFGSFNGSETGSLFSSLSAGLSLQFLLPLGFNGNHSLSLHFHPQIPQSFLVSLFLRLCNSPRFSLGFLSCLLLGHSTEDRLSFFSGFLLFDCLLAGHFSGEGSFSLLPLSFDCQLSEPFCFSLLSLESGLLLCRCDSGLLLTFSFKSGQLCKSSGFSLCSKSLLLGADPCLFLLFRDPGFLGSDAGSLLLSSDSGLLSSDPSSLSFRSEPLFLDSGSLLSSYSCCFESGSLNSCGFLGSLPLALDSNGFQAGGLFRSLASCLESCSFFSSPAFSLNLG